MKENVVEWVEFEDFRLSVVVTLADDHPLYMRNMPQPYHTASIKNIESIKA